MVVCLIKKNFTTTKVRQDLDDVFDDFYIQNNTVWDKKNLINHLKDHDLQIKNKIEPILSTINKYIKNEITPIMELKKKMKFKNEDEMMFVANLGDEIRKHLREVIKQAHPISDLVNLRILIELIKKKKFNIKDNNDILEKWIKWLQDNATKIITEHKGQIKNFSQINTIESNEEYAIRLFSELQNNLKSKSSEKSHYEDNKEMFEIIDTYLEENIDKDVDGFDKLNGLRHNYLSNVDINELIKENVKHYNNYLIYYNSYIFYAIHYGLKYNVNIRIFICQSYDDVNIIYEKRKCNESSIINYNKQKCSEMIKMEDQAIKCKVEVYKINETDDYINLLHLPFIPGHFMLLIPQQKPQVGGSNNIKQTAKQYFKNNRNETLYKVNNYIAKRNMNHIKIYKNM